MKGKYSQGLETGKLLRSAFWCLLWVSLTLKMFLRLHCPCTQTLFFPLRWLFHWPPGFFLQPVGTWQEPNRLGCGRVSFRPQALGRSSLAWFRSQHWVLSQWPRWGTLQLCLGYIKSKHPHLGLRAVGGEMSEVELLAQCLISVNTPGGAIIAII